MNILSGLAANKGEISGRPIVAMSPGEAEQQIKLYTDKDFILVVPATDPTWLTTMIKFKGIITDSGGVLSHAAIISREFGIPCVVGTKEGTQRLLNISQVTIKGEKGEIFY